MSDRGRRRVWCEFARADEVVRSGLLAALAERRIALLFAVTPGDERDALAIVKACRAASVEIGLWPMLAPERGRWANELTAHELSAFVAGLFASLASEGALPDELAIDLEPPFDLLARRDVASLVAFARGRRHGGSERLAALATEARERGLRVLAATLPVVLADGPEARLQRLLATPLSVLGEAHVSVMMYSSLVEGYAGRALDRADVRALTFEVARRAARRRDHGLSLGAIATGALGDEAVYPSPEELADDVAIASCAGVRDLALFSLCGVLRRGDATRWLDAFLTEHKSCAPSRTWRADLAIRALDALGGARATP
ncbi:MAG: hypothetical protein FJ096_02150 [Deltaproteobacteria bacterium]|nr:hypothetical protein [Deltaproteobacteria bacterium]